MSSQLKPAMVSVHLQIPADDVAQIDRYLAREWEVTKRYPKPSRNDYLRNCIQRGVELCAMANRESDNFEAKKKQAEADLAQGLHGFREDQSQPRKVKLVDWNKAEVDAEKAMRSVLKRGHKPRARVSRVKGKIHLNVSPNGLLKGHEVEDLHNAVVALGWKQLGEDYGVEYVEDTIKLTPSPRAKRREPKETVDRPKTRRTMVIGGVDAEAAKKATHTKRREGTVRGDDPRITVRPGESISISDSDLDAPKKRQR